MLVHRSVAGVQLNLLQVIMITQIQFAGFRTHIMFHFQGLLQKNKNQGEFSSDEK